ncbi:MAG: sulfite oxidase-like oxidoreductase [Geminicoccaceae bacterium]|nr:sulfite oxidase-like oxidoreductase [Geminicoccaceae bacterium]
MDQPRKPSTLTTDAPEGRLPPRQVLTRRFPVLSAGAVPAIDLETWSFTVWNGPRPLARWDWAGFNALPRTRWTKDIHCVTRWSKLDVAWEGVLVGDLMEAAGLAAPTPFTLALCFGDYSTNLPYADLADGRAMVATHAEGEPLTPEHGGPARLVVPHLYFWKSAKWVRGLRFTRRDEAGFWELRGYHMRGDPWKNERYDVGK